MNVISTKFCIAAGLLIVSFFSPSGDASDCALSENEKRESKQHTYQLSVTSPTGTPVRIKGSIAVGNPDRFISVDAETPYDLTVIGANYLLIVGATELRNSINFSLSIDGRIATSGSDNLLYTVGDGIPQPGGLFSANYQIEAATH